ncbi:MAG: methyltransferase domain-containing protein [Candidatus Acididesulfobacter guangdongensis]|uniref:Methyltransferase domain-containing protein n=1 Tax=Acididesulfobacter guangdongensis TaxID=2597225 RepID=A0A519BJ77_ACIG2|nr:MAG: methyltransferase domain-containing protein [Candidatus Acididesulfobacter guangdongensis]
MITENAVQGCKLQKSLNFSQDEELYIATSDTKGKMENDYKPFVNKILNSISFVPDSVLDLGCGPGYIARRFSEVLPNANIVGVDISEIMISHALKSSAKITDEANPNFSRRDMQAAGARFANNYYDNCDNKIKNNMYDAKVAEHMAAAGNLNVNLNVNAYDLNNGYFHQKLRYLIANSECLPFSDNYFDVIILKGTFKCLERKAESLKEMHRILSSRGEILIFEFRKDIPEDEFLILTKDMQPQKVRSLRNKLNCSPDLAEYKYCLSKSNLSKFAEITSDGLDLKIRIVK